MSLARTNSALVDGVEGQPVTVELHLDSGLPGVHIVGLPDQAVKESRERIRPALKENGFKFPNQKVTINLSPADQSKQGSTYDLPIALALLQASGQLEVDAMDMESTMFVGEVSLDGTLQPVPGVLPMTMAGKEQKLQRAMVPRANALEAAETGIEVLPVEHLREAVGILEGHVSVADLPDPTPTGSMSTELDFSDVRGQESAKRALTLAAAGGHNLLMIGPPGTGKSMLARRLPTILPELSREQALTSTAIHSVAGEIPEHGTLLEDPPFRNPHHTTSGAGLIGGGNDPSPGEVSLAHNGVLFLDEIPEFARSHLETLRQPLESGEVHLSRARSRNVFPAEFQLVAAMNPCPCGYLTHPDRECVCRPGQIDRYISKLSGPMLDRVDLHVSVGPVEYDELRGDTGDEPKSSAELRRAVESARERQQRRNEQCGVQTNAELPASELEEICNLTESAHDMLRQAVDRRGLSARSVHRIQKVSLTLADLDGADTVTDNYVAEALQFRQFEKGQYLH